MMYATPLISELENLNSDVQNVCENYVKSITELILAHSQCLAVPICNRKRNCELCIVILCLIPGKTMISVPL